jgi:hypothetical protein
MTDKALKILVEVYCQVSFHLNLVPHRLVLVLRLQEAMYHRVTTRHAQS